MSTSQSKSIASSSIEQIKNIIKSKSTNFRIMNKIQQYSDTEIITSILLLALEDNILCIKLVLLFQYLKSQNSNQFVEKFFSIAKKIRSDLFLQICCLFHVFTYDELQLNISYVREIDHFKTFPIISYTISRNEILEKARNT